MKKVILVIGTLASLGLASSPGYGEGTPANAHSPQAQFSPQKLELKPNPQLKIESNKGVEEQKQKLDTLKQSVNQDVKVGLEKVQQAILALDNGKADDALKLLKEALGSFDAALAVNPNLGLTPVDRVTEVQELYTDAPTIKRQVALARDLLESGNVQAARSVLIPLRSDVAEAVTYLPMATYPEAIRRAVKQITDGQIEQAKGTLAVAMNTVVVADQRVVPVPVLAARSLVDEASKMDKSKKDEITRKLSAAQDQLEIARLLGYPVEKSSGYRQVQADIAKIKTEIRGQNRVEKMYQDLNARLSGWVDAMSNKLTK